MRERWTNLAQGRIDAGSPSAGRRPYRKALLAIVVLLGLFSLSIPPIPAEAQTVAAPPNPASSIPDAPEPQGPQAQAMVRSKSKTPPCRVVPDSEAMGSAGAAVGFAVSSSVAGVSPTGTHEESGQDGGPSPLPACPTAPINWFARFLNGPQVKRLTPKEKALLAVRNVIDPFNAITILANAAIAVGSDSHSPYGPGMTGFGRYTGVEYSQDMTGEFFGTFLIPSVVHQDPHYHRMPKGSYVQRVRHAIVQVVWTQGDNGKGMLNYANLVGFAIDDEIGDLYVPDRQTDLGASATRYATGLALAPTDNFITEFLPDVARRIHIHIVLVQNIIDQVAKTEGAGTSQ